MNNKEIDFSNNNEEINSLRFHISYASELSLKDFRDMIDLLRMSTNDALRSTGNTGKNINKNTKIKAVNHGSIELVVQILALTTSILEIGGLVAAFIEKHVKKKREREISTKSHAERFIYELEEIKVFYELSNKTIHIYINNK